jgi:hypothetical protein
MHVFTVAAGSVRRGRRERSNKEGDVEPWLRMPFSPEHSYTVLRSAIRCSDKLIKGETVRFLRADYSSLLGHTVYRFVAADGSERSWTLMDDEPVDWWTLFFARSM